MKFELDTSFIFYLDAVFRFHNFSETYVEYFMDSDLKKG